MPKISKHGGPTVEGAEVVQQAEGNVRTGAGLGPDPHAEPEFVSNDAQDAEGLEYGAQTDADLRADYEALTVEQLRDELFRRNLSTSGNKPALVDRLVEDDHREPEPPL